MRVQLLQSVGTTSGILMAGRTFDSKEDEIPQEVMEALSEQSSRIGRKVVEVLRLDEGEVIPNGSVEGKAGVKAPAPRRKATKTAQSE